MLGLKATSLNSDYNTIEDFNMLIQSMFVNVIWKEKILITPL